MPFWNTVGHMRLADKPSKWTSEVLATPLVGTNPKTQPTSALPVAGEESQRLSASFRDYSRGPVIFLRASNDAGLSRNSDKIVRTRSAAPLIALRTISRRPAGVKFCFVRA